MYFIYNTSQALDKHIRPSYRFGAFSGKNHNDAIVGIIKSHLAGAIINRTMSCYFLKHTKKNNEEIMTFAVRFDNEAKTKPIRGFVDVQIVSLGKYLKTKCAHFFSYWIKDNTPNQSESDAFTK